MRQIFASYRVHCTRLAANACRYSPHAFLHGRAAVRHCGFFMRDFGLVSCRASPAGILAKLIPRLNASCTSLRYDTRQKACNFTLAINQPHDRSTSAFVLICRQRSQKYCRFAWKLLRRAGALQQGSCRNTIYQDVYSCHQSCQHLISPEMARKDVMNSLSQHTIRAWSDMHI